MGTKLGAGNAHDIQSDAANLKHLPEDAEAALWYIYHSGLNLQKTEVYFSTPELQEAGYGCETFALKSALYFLRNLEFFDQINPESSQQIGELLVKPFKNLPPALLKVSQMENIKGVFLKHHLIEVTKGEKSYTVIQNYYLNHQSMKYHLIALRTLKVLTPEEIEKLLSETLLTVLRPERLPGDLPRTLSDVAQYKASLSKSPDQALLPIGTNPSQHIIEPRPVSEQEQKQPVTLLTLPDERLE